ncbi:MAG: hypothetical protein EHM70_20230 [Chloroflexota bacterium]|nr:MAG: hypothetical protein EHM70_20230 [Chloroflexota bacterium]
MNSILKSTICGKTDFSKADTLATSPDPCPTDPWLFTDPLAREIYQRRDQLEALEEDICLYVMYDGQWAPEELECKCEIRRLLREGLLTAKGSFGDLSPHPTIYSAYGEGELKVAGRRFPFDIGEEIVFEPWLARLSRPGLYGPVRVGWVRQVTSELCLCCEAFHHICIQCEKTRTTMRQILTYQSNGK